jgi:hypothetical protein
VAVVRSIEPPPLDFRNDDTAADAGRPRAGETRPAAAALKPPARPSAEAPAPRVEPAPVVAAAAEPSAAPEPARDSGSSEPLRGLAGRGPVPVILVARTLWHPSAERREALIEVEEGAGPERRRVREGDVVGPLRVEKIEPSGVVFDYDGTELRHSVGSDSD